MTGHHVTRRGLASAATALAVALALPAAATAATPPAAAPAAATAAPDVAGDPAAAWTAFLADPAGVDRLAPAFDTYHALEYRDGKVQADSCRAQADALRRAVASVPVSIALRRGAMHCAEALGDEAGAEREMAALSSLVAHALAAAPDVHVSRPIRVVRLEDATALMTTLGLGADYTYLPQVRPDRWLPQVVGAWDARAGIERRFAFDMLDVLATLRSPDPEYGFPVHRHRIARSMITSRAEAGQPAYTDAMAAIGAWQATDRDKALGLLRDAALQGGLTSARRIAAHCLTEARKAPSPGCGRGLADALMPAAEARNGYAMAMLALVYEAGIGVAADPAAAATLADAADRRMGGHAASVEMAAIYREAGHATLPAATLARVRNAAAAGDIAATLVMLEEAGADAAALAAAEALADARANDRGQVERAIAMHLEQRDPADEAAAFTWWRRAAAKGNDDALQVLGGARYFGTRGEAQDADGARVLLRESARASRFWPANLLAAEAQRAGRIAEVEYLLLPAVWSGNGDAAVTLARAVLGTPEAQRATVTGEQALSLLRGQADGGDAEARRVLAGMLAWGQGVPKDVPAARRLLEAAIAEGDQEAAVDLAGVELHADETPDEAAALRWLQPALDAGLASAHALRGDWLYFRGGGSDAVRASAFTHWQKAADGDNFGAMNNAAWQWCVAPADLDAARGLAMARRMTTYPSLPASFLDTVAACEAANGDFEAAVRLQDQAIAAVAHLQGAEEEDDGGMRARRGLYAQRKPFLEEKSPHAKDADARD